MNKILSILLPHSDDELFILPLIESKILQGFLVKVFFITTDFNPGRARESGKMLSQYNEVEIIEFGTINNVIDGKLRLSSDKVLALLDIDSIIQSSQLLVCPTFEGGHVDHDEIFKISYALALKHKMPLYCFSLYNAYQTPFVRVSTLFQGPVQGEKEIISFSLKRGISYVKNCFIYKSQFVILMILFFGIFRTFILKRRIEVLKVTHFDPGIPHPGKIFYENPWKNKIKSFLRVK